MKAVLALLGALLACQTVSAYFAPGYGVGYGVGFVEDCVEPVIPVSGGLVDARSYVDSYFPGSSYCGYGTYGPAYGGLGYPLDVYGPSVFPYPGLGYPYEGYGPGYGIGPGFGYGPGCGGVFI